MSEPTCLVSDNVCGPTVTFPVCVNVSAEVIVGRLLLLLFIGLHKPKLLNLLIV